MALSTKSLYWNYYKTPLRYKDYLDVIKKGGSSYIKCKTSAGTLITTICNDAFCSQLVQVLIGN